ncbi:unnamed protein product [Rotaria socialis]|uniref:G protein-coupled receptor n=1 Tax=Rotaria socialis TaxID=392032 RepID=A0A818FD54_9BILA|nr:unnamed protein product [Rotaria socialis]CAF3471852.1 unnamed protein product [Rotaria socialis]
MSTTDAYDTTVSIIMGHISYSINIFTIIFGTIGGTCTLITYTAAQFRRNACVFYLLCANSFQMISIIVPVSIRALVGYLGDNLERQSLFFCKFCYFASFTLPHLATLYMLLSILDRYLVTSSKAKYRARTRDVTIPYRDT